MSKEPIPSVEILTEQLHGVDWMARCDAARLLGQSRDPRAVDALLPDLDDMAWKFGVMFADARDAKQDRVIRLMELLASDTALKRSAAALTLPWYGDERSIELLKQLQNDPDEMVRTIASWTIHSLRKVLLYRNQSGL